MRNATSARCAFRMRQSDPQRPSCADSRSPRPARPSYVYLLVHRGEPRFKIGKANDPKARAAKLPEAPLIDQEKSLTAMLPTQARAIEVERMLHKALAGFRLTLYDGPGTTWDGSTEWFSVTGLRHAINLLRATPLGGAESARVQLTNLQGQSIATPAPDQSRVSPRTQRRTEAADYNVEQIDKVSQILLSLACEFPMSYDCDPSGERLMIHGLKSAWQLHLLRARFEVVSSALWTLRTGAKDPGRETKPLVSIMQYSKSEPDTMEFHINREEVIRRLPAGAMVIEQWRRLVSEVTRAWSGRV
jgi:hypothetical protein